MLFHYIWKSGHFIVKDTYAFKGRVYDDSPIHSSSLLKASKRVSLATSNSQLQMIATLPSRFLLLEESNSTNLTFLRKQYWPVNKFGLDWLYVIYLKRIVLYTDWDKSKFVKLSS